MLVLNDFWRNVIYHVCAYEGFLFASFAEARALNSYALNTF